MRRGRRRKQNLHARMEELPEEVARASEEDEEARPRDRRDRRAEILEEFEAHREEPEALVAMFHRLARSSFDHAWDVLRAVEQAHRDAADARRKAEEAAKEAEKEGKVAPAIDIIHPPDLLTEDERFLLAEAVNKRLAGGTPGSVIRRHNMA